jgi:hypothetical protein
VSQSVILVGLMAERRKRGRKPSESSYDLSDGGTVRGYALPSLQQQQARSQHIVVSLVLPGREEGRRALFASASPTFASVGLVPRPLQQPDRSQPSPDNSHGFGRRCCFHFPSPLPNRPSEGSPLLCGGGPWGPFRYSTGRHNPNARRAALRSAERRPISEVMLGID